MASAFAYSSSANADKDGSGGTGGQARALYRKLLIYHQSSSCLMQAGIGLTVYQLTERDTGTKVDHLQRLHLYDTAASVAASANYGRENIGR
jgi:hypothetical protein